MKRNRVQGGGGVVGKEDIIILLISVCVIYFVNLQLIINKLTPICFLIICIDKDKTKPKK
jgi:hypothetical protein